MFMFSIMFFIQFSATPPTHTKVWIDNLNHFIYTLIYFNDYNFIYFNDFIYFVTLYALIYFNDFIYFI